MHPRLPHSVGTALLVALGASAMSACDRSPSAPPKPADSTSAAPAPAPAPAPTPAPAGASGGGTAPMAGHAHDDHGDGHHHGPTTELGEQSAGGFTVKASRDGDAVAGHDVPIDVWITGGASKVRTVRFWIGTKEGRGSTKAKAELERDNWHTHVDAPDPMPAGSRLWIEIETEAGERVLADFDLKQ